MEYVPSGVCLTAYSGGCEEFLATPLQEMVERIEEGELHLQIGRTFGLEDIVETHRVMDGNTAGGKIVVLT